MKPYQDPNHEGNSAKHHTGKPCSVAGCSSPAGTWWGPHWCMQHNIERLDRITKFLDDIAAEYVRRQADFMRGHAMGLAGEPSPGTDNWDLWGGWTAGNAKREIDG